MGDTRQATVKSTGGGGFRFEDQVAAYFLACLISFRAPLTASLGLLERVEFQRTTAGWQLDDMVLTLHDSVGLRRAAFSVKSNAQFGKHTAPAEFVAQAWRQLLVPGSSAFNPERDVLGLITAPLDRELESGLDTLIQLALKQEDEQLEREVTKALGKTRSQLYRSFACPADLTGQERPSTGRLLRVLQFPRQYDFQSPGSHRELEAVERCRDALVSEALSEAQEVWRALLGIAQEFRTQGGYLDTERVFARLRAFRFKGRPEHAAAWNRWLTLSRESMERTVDRLGGHLQLPRTAAVAALALASRQHRRVALVGASGSGKSVLAWRWAEGERSAGNTVIWLEAQNLEGQSLAAFEATLQLGVDIRTLLNGVFDVQATLVIDGLDRVYEVQAFSNLATLLTLLRLDDPSSPWRVVLTCQTAEWARVDRLLRSTGQPVWAVEPSLDLAEPDRRELLQAFPALGRLFLHPSLFKVWNNLQLLQVVALNLSQITSEHIQPRWIHESEVIEWIWNHTFASPGVSRVAKRLAERQADGLRADVTELDFDEGELPSMEALVQAHICRRQKERYRFEHDLFGDWARQRLLLDHQDQLELYLRHRMGSPLWHRAVRLYGQQQLETDTDAQRWASAFTALTGHVVAQDLLLEAPVLAADAWGMLERISEVLFAANGLLLRRLLKRLLYTLSVEDAPIVEFAVQQGVPPEQAAVHYRDPKPYVLAWTAVLQFLDQHQQRVIQSAPLEAAKLVDLWLTETPEHAVGRPAAARVALALGEAELNKRRSTASGDRTQIYRAALRAGDLLPDDTARFALRASQRTGLSADSQPSTDQRQLGRPLTDRWPDGPKGRIDDAFRQTALDGVGLKPLMRSRPAVAREVILSLLIWPPEKRQVHGWSDQQDLQVVDVRAWDPPMYTHGHVLFLLETQFDEGLQLVLRLVQFAAERWLDDVRQREQGMPLTSRSTRELTLMLDGEPRRLIGDLGLFGWYRGLYTGTPQPPKAVTSVLMALEQALYRRLDAEEDLEDMLRLILGRTHNVAVIGVLCAVARRAPALLEGVLSPLLSSIQVFNWDLQVTTSEFSSHLLMGAAMRGERFYDLASAFHKLPHRQRSLERLVENLMFRRPAIQALLERAIPTWVQQLEAIDETQVSRLYAEKLILGFDLTRWEVVQRGDQTVRRNPAVMEWQARQQQDPVHTLFADGAFLSSLVFQCRQRLQAGTPMAETDVQPFWDALQRAQVFASQADVQWGHDTPATVQIGGAAVLQTLHPDWLAQHPERQAWCANVLRRTLEEAWTLDMPDRVEYGATHDGLLFAAFLLPTVWASAPASTLFRRGVVALLLKGSSEVLSVLMAGCFRYRHQLGEHLQSLLRLVLEIAARRFRLLSVQWPFQHGDREYQALLASALQDGETVWEQQWVEGFVTGTCPTEGVAWSALSSHTVYQYVDELLFRHGGKDGQPLIDLSYVQYTHPFVAQLSVEEQRAFWTQALRTALVRARPVQKRDQELEVELPVADECWILTGAASSMLDLAPDAAQALWEPVLSLSVGSWQDRQPWITEFLDAWHLAAQNLDPSPPSYLQHTQAMAAYALESLDAGGPWSMLGEAWLSLLVLEHSLVRRWQQRHEPVITALLPLYQRWLSATHCRPAALTAFVRLLVRPAAAVIRLDGLDLITTHLANRSWLLADMDLDTVVALLASCWQQQDALRRSPERFVHFQALLQAAGSLQHPGALALFSTISQNHSSGQL